MYNWDVNHRLRSMVNELTGIRVSYGYDEFSNLVWSNQGGQFDFLHRSVDDVGNLYETKEKTDRVYGAGSRLLETRDAKFSYDEEGNLVQKVEKNGDTWKYEYYGNGMMSKVIKPDNTEVTFKYDSLGRRIEKCSDEKTMKFVWDGNTSLHEYFLHDNSDIFENIDEYSSQNKSEIPDNLVTWVFNDGFVPSAKITNEGNYSIVSDYLGTPVEAYDEEGNRVWSADLDIYGRVNEFTGERDFIPFRYQGQYEDMEIGLYYNRFRYYSPSEGMYIQSDPIGLNGGIRLYSYVRDTNVYIDILGLKGTFSVYHLYDVVGGKRADNPYYVGITEDIDQRRQDHIDTGRLTKDGKTALVEYKNGLTEPQARGIEQAHIQHYDTQTGIRKGTVMPDGSIHDGALSQSNRGNKNNSFLENNTRDRNRQAEMVRSRNKELAKLKGGCLG
ncbi:RHS repeat domain-containing protein [Lysinibacillus sp. TE18511]